MIKWPSLANSEAMQDDIILYVIQIIANIIFSIIMGLIGAYLGIKRMATKERLSREEIILRYDLDHRRQILEEYRGLIVTSKEVIDDLRNDMTELTKVLIEMYKKIETPNKETAEQKPSTDKMKDDEPKGR